MSSIIPPYLKYIRSNLTKNLLDSTAFLTITWSASFLSLRSSALADFASLVVVHDEITKRVMIIVNSFFIAHILLDKIQISCHSVSSDNYYMQCLTMLFAG